MRLNRSRSSSNIEDRRSQRRGMHIGKGGSIGIGTIILALVALYFGVDPSVVLQQAQGPATYEETGAPLNPNDPQTQFVAKVLGETEDTWQTIFQNQTNGAYREPSMVLFRGATSTACGMGQSAMGPFYCPADSKIYIDLGFFDELLQKLNAPGDFAQAYVIAHEVGHHVQNLLGATERYHQLRPRLSTAEANQLSVRMELQADCFAGVWAHHAHSLRQVLEEGDIEEGLRAASAVGDDALQRQTQGRVVPDSFTHGTSQQRTRWFARGFESGQMVECDTFSVSNL